MLQTLLKTKESPASLESRQLPPSTTIPLHTRCGSGFARLTPTFYASHGYIERVTFSEGEYPKIISRYHNQELNQLIEQWLSEYLSGKEPTAQLPLIAPISPALQAIKAIPFGVTRFYRDIASAIGNPQAARAIGRVCHANPYPLIIPCHRVIKANGTLGGFAYPLALKRSLLDFERSFGRKDHSI